MFGEEIATIYLDNTDASMQELAIVILNYKGLQHLTTFLPNVCANSVGFPIIIIDNASTDESVSFLIKSFPSVECISLPQNYGFAEGYNEGLGQLKGRFKNYILLNNDVEVTSNWIPPLLSALADETVAGCQPKVLSYTKKTHFEHAGAAGGYLDKNYFPFCRGRIFNHCEEDQGQYDYKKKVDWTSGAAMLIRADLFHDVGGFDSDFLAHMEEIDLCLRLNHAGYSFVCEPASVVYHLGGGTMPYTSPTKTFLNFRNNIMLLVKNHRGFWGPRLVIRMIYDGIAGLQFLLKGKFSFFIMIFLAHLSFYTKIQKVLQKRKQLKRVQNKVPSYSGNIIFDYYFKNNKTFTKLNKRRFLS